MVEVFAVALIIASAMAIAVMIVAQPWDRPRDANGLPMSVLSGMAGFSALLSTLGYVIASGDGHSVMPLVVADITMPLAVGLLWAALRRFRNAEHSILPVILIPSIIVGLTTLLISPDVGQVAKLIVIVVFCAASTWEAFRFNVPFTPGRVIVAVAMIVYGVYNLARAIGIFAVDPASDLFRYTLDTAPSGIVGAVVIATSAVGGISLARTESATQRSSRVLSARAFRAAADLRFEVTSPLPVVLISIHDLSLQRTAYGISWAREVFAAAIDAADAAFPSDVLIGQSRPGILATLSTQRTLDEGVEADVRALFAEQIELRGIRNDPDLSVQQLMLPSMLAIEQLAKPSGRADAGTRPSSV